MQKEILAIFIAVALVGMIGFLTNGEITGEAFGRWGGSSSYYRPPQQYYPAPQPIQQVQPVQPAKQQINPDTWAAGFVQTMVNSVKDGATCKNNCGPVFLGNCNNLKVQGFLPPQTDCNALLSKYAQQCVQKCDAKFPPQPAKTSWGWTATPAMPVQQPTPAQQQTQKPTAQQCATNCDNSAALLYKQCMDQGAGETACQNAGKLTKESCTRKCFLGY